MCAVNVFADAALHGTRDTPPSLLPILNAPASAPTQPLPPRGKGYSDLIPLGRHDATSDPTSAPAVLSVPSSVFAVMNLFAPPPASPAQAGTQTTARRPRLRHGTAGIPRRINALPASRPDLPALLRNAPTLSARPAAQEALQTVQTVNFTPLRWERGQGVRGSPYPSA